MINEYLRMVLTSEPLLPIQKSNMHSLFTTNFGRSYFCKILFQSKFKEHKSHCLADESFNDLYHMIFGVIVSMQNEDNLSNIENAKLLTKSSFFYYR
jgi:hypothetical protein